ncbi:MAG: FMN reductase (NADPH) [Syntrophaceae bacterium PtaB.Bin038]|jgi:nitroreductase|nr:MAG: FMN reductase (NADPH) [Syntrophaceae bacterium PtaB.Bin038]
MGVFNSRLPACIVMISLAGSAWAAEEVLMNDTLKTIFARKSVRSYRTEAVSDEKLQMLVRAGMAAPTAVDKRPWEFVVVTDRAVLKRLADALPYAKMAERAAAAIVVGGDVRRQWGGMESDYWIMDCSAATQNILLAAESMGLGAVWTAVYPEDSRVRAVRQILGIPPHVVPLNVIPVGVPSGREKPKDKYDPKQIHWNKW